MPRIEVIFPGLRTGSYHVTSPATDEYNCIAWAAGDTAQWWWPDPDPDAVVFWPPGVPRERTRDAFVAAFASLGYAACEGEGPEAGYEKIALFADAEGRPTHAARQLPGGRWTSKLGIAEDIEHGLHDLEGAIYGAVVLVMKRSARTAADGGAKE
jgi:hypothetical protein